jgi:hypothetical protein
MKAILVICSALAAILMAWLMADDEKPKPSHYWLEPPPD